MQRAGRCTQGNCLPILAVGRTEVSHGWRVTAAPLPNPKLPYYKPPMTLPKLWDLTFVPREAPKQYASLTCSSIQIILDKLLEFCGGKKKSEILPTEFTLLCIFITNTSHKYSISERRAVTFWTLIANAVAFLHVMSHLVPVMSTKEVIRLTPTQG